jgi:2-polyprenyl-6-methoxyphenol hydroxylase-like FAD-dependent oxidoreductase
MPARLRILIVGGGIAGLALARALREQGLVPEVIDRTASWPAGGTGLYLPGNGVRGLGALGLADKCWLELSACRISEFWITRDATGRKLI